MNVVTLPSARMVRDVLGQVEIGCYMVDHDPSDQHAGFRHLWRVKSPPDSEGFREVLDEHATYREAVRDAKARCRGEFGDERGDDRRAKTPAEQAAKHRKAASTYPAGSVGRAFHEGLARELDPGTAYTADEWQETMNEVLRRDSAVRPLYRGPGAQGEACESGPAPATIGDMPTRKPDPIQAVRSHTGFRLARPGARYAVHYAGDARPGAWLPDGEALPDGWTDVYLEDTARALLPFLRATSHGRRAAEPTTPDGKLIARACKRLGLTAAALGEQIGAAEAVLSRARNGELPAKHREAIKALLAPKKRKQKATT